MYLELPNRSIENSGSGGSGDHTERGFDVATLVVVLHEPLLVATKVIIHTPPVRVRSSLVGIAVSSINQLTASQLAMGAEIAPPLAADQGT
jgi:hypothetical protein